MRIVFFIINYGYFSDVSVALFLSYCFYALKFDTTAIIYINILVMLMMLLPFKFRHRRAYQKIVFYVFIICNTIGIIANAVDFAYYPFILQRSTSSIFDFFVTDTSNIGGVIFSYLITYWYVLPSVVFFVWLLIFMNKKIKLTSEKNTQNAWTYFTLNLVILAASFGLSLGLVRGGFTLTTRPITISNSAKYIRKPSHSALVLNTPFCIIRTLRKEDVKRVNYFNDEGLNAIINPIKKVADTTAHKQLNVVILILESFGKEYSGLLNPHLYEAENGGYTPFLDSLMLKSKVYINAYANGRKSIDAIPSVVAGVPSLVNPYITSHHSTNDIEALPKLLKKKGYTSVFYHGAPNGSMGFDAFCNIIGFDKYYGMHNYIEKHDFKGNPWGVFDEDFFSFFNEGLRELEQPFFATFFSLSSHGPFVVPDKYKDKLRKGPLEIHELIHYTDVSLRNFFNEASQQDWYENTLFIITPDHCSTPHFPEYKTSAGYFSIPLIFYKEGLINAGFDSTFAQQIDILPTVLNMIGYEDYFFSLGTNLNNSDEPHFSINFLDGNYQLFKDGYLLQFDTEKIIAIYDLKNDKMLTSNLKNKIGDKEKELEIFTKAFVQQYNNRMLDNNMTATRK